MYKRQAKNKEYMDDLTEFVGLSEDDGALKEKNASPDVVEEVEFRDVSFRYPGTDSYILKHFSLRIEKGRHYAFVGINGAGKTTIVKLLTGLYREYEGDIFINGRNSREYDSRQLMDMFSVVYQDFARYQISFADNIQMCIRDRHHSFLVRIDSRSRFIQYDKLMLPVVSSGDGNPLPLAA